MKTANNATLMLAILCVMGLAACKPDPANAVHDSDWYLANGPEMKSKLESCKADPVAAKADVECTAATNAFLRWYAASGQQAAQASKDASMDSRLSAPAPDAVAPSSDAAAPVVDAPADSGASAEKQDPSKTTP